MPWQSSQPTKINNPLLKELISRYATWQGGKKSLNRIGNILENAKDLPDFIEIVKGFKKHIETSFHPHRYQRTPLFLDAYHVGETACYKELVKIVNSYLPPKASTLATDVTIVATNFLKGVLQVPSKIANFISHDPNAAKLVAAAFTLPLLPSARANQTIRSDELGVQYGICSSRLTLDAYPISYICSSLAAVEYSQNPTKYTNDTLTVHGIFEDLNANPILNCKLAQVLAYEPRFRIKFLARSEVPSSARAQYKEAEVSIQIPAGVRNTKSMQQVIEHELHHAFIANRNKLQGKNYNSMYNVNNADQRDFTRPEDAVEFQAVLTSGVKRIIELYNIAQKIKTSVPITRDEEYKFEMYKNALKKDNYIPKEHRRAYTDMSLLNALMAKGIINSQYQMIVKDYLQNFDILIANTVIQVNLRVYDIEVQKDRFVLIGDLAARSGDQPLVPLYDGLMYVNAVNTDIVLGEPHIEVDAYLHECFGSRPNLFKYLFKELRKYHHERDTESFRECYRRAT